MPSFYQNMKNQSLLPSVVLQYLNKSQQFQRCCCINSRSITKQQQQQQQVTVSMCVGSCRSLSSMTEAMAIRTLSSSWITAYLYSIRTAESIRIHKSKSFSMSTKLPPLEKHSNANQKQTDKYQQKEKQKSQPRQVQQQQSNDGNCYNNDCGGKGASLEMLESNTTYSILRNMMNLNANVTNSNENNSSSNNSDSSLVTRSKTYPLKDIYNMHPSLRRALHSQKIYSLTTIQYETWKCYYEDDDDNNKSATKISYNETDGHDKNDTNDASSSCCMIHKNCNDIIAISPTGTGKTLAFLLPIINDQLFLVDINNNNKNSNNNSLSKINKVHTLILVPTRELAQQIHTVVSGILSIMSLTMVFDFGFNDTNDSDDTDDDDDNDDDDDDDNDYIDPGPPIVASQAVYNLRAQFMYGGIQRKFDMDSFFSRSNRPSTMTSGSTSATASSSKRKIVPDIVIATPGRLLDHCRFVQNNEEGTSSSRLLNNNKNNNNTSDASFASYLSSIDVLIIDEMDRLLDKNFRTDVTEIVAQLFGKHEKHLERKQQKQQQQRRRTMFFSATHLPPSKDTKILHSTVLEKVRAEGAEQSNLRIINIDSSSRVLSTNTILQTIYDTPIHPLDDDDDDDDDDMYNDKNVNKITNNRSINSINRPPPTIRQTYVVLPNDSIISGIIQIVQYILDESDSTLTSSSIQPKKVLVFFPTTSQVQYYTNIFRDILGIRVLSIHSSLSQGRRNLVSQQFRNHGRNNIVYMGDPATATAINATTSTLLSTPAQRHQLHNEPIVMFTTDVSARGVDYPNVSHVVQVGMAPDKDTYLHRIGRTGRMGKTGHAITVFISLAEMNAFLYRELADICIDITLNKTIQDLVRQPLPLHLQDTLLRIQYATRNGGTIGKNRSSTRSTFGRDDNDKKKYKANKSNNSNDVDVDCTLYQNAEAVYFSLLAFYSSRFNRMGMDNTRDELVTIANTFAIEAGFTELPKITEREAKMYGIKDHPGIQTISKKWDPTISHFHVGLQTKD